MLLVKLQQTSILTRNLASYINVKPHSLWIKAHLGKKMTLVPNECFFCLMGSFKGLCDIIKNKIHIFMYVYTIHNFLTAFSSLKPTKWQFKMVLCNVNCPQLDQIWTCWWFHILASRKLDPCVLYGCRTIPIVLLNASGWSPGTALDCMLGTGSRKLWLMPGKSTKWADSSLSAQRTPRSCTFFHCQGRREAERRRGEREAERGTVGGSWTGQASKTQRVVFFEI